MDRSRQFDTALVVYEAPERTTDRYFFKTLILMLIRVVFIFKL
jgi:hypothetical protein